MNSSGDFHTVRRNPEQVGQGPQRFLKGLPLRSLPYQIWVGLRLCERNHCNPGFNLNPDRFPDQDDGHALIGPLAFDQQCFANK